MWGDPSYKRLSSTTVFMLSLTITGAQRKSHLRQVHKIPGLVAPPPPLTAPTRKRNRYGAPWNETNLSDDFRLSSFDPELYQSVVSSRKQNLSLSIKNYQFILTTFKMELYVVIISGIQKKVLSPITLKAAKWMCRLKDSQTDKPHLSTIYI